MKEEESKKTRLVRACFIFLLSWLSSSGITRSFFLRCFIDIIIVWGNVLEFFSLFGSTRSFIYRKGHLLAATVPKNPFSNFLICQKYESLRSYRFLAQWYHDIPFFLQTDQCLTNSEMANERLGCGGLVGVSRLEISSLGKSIPLLFVLK